MSELDQLRKEIDGIDRRIAELFQQRMDTTRRVGLYKLRNGVTVLDEAREKEILASKAGLSDDPAMQSALNSLFECILSISRKQQRRMMDETDLWFEFYHFDRSETRSPLPNPRVIYPGEPGSCSDQAAGQFFGEEIPRQNIPAQEEVFLALKEGRADYGVVPIENSSSGSINPTYDLLAQYGAHIVGEQILSSDDCGYTRFVVVSPVMERRENANKISALFALPHKSGALHRILSVFAVAGLSLMKLESRPVVGRSWEYLFFVDFSGNLDDPGMDSVIRELTQSADGFRILGNYKACEE